MSVFTDMYDAFNSVLQEARDKGKELTEELRSGKLSAKAEETFNKIKQAFYDFGYSLSSKKNAKADNSSTEVTSNPRTQNPSNEALINTLIEMDNEYRKEHTGVDIAAPSIPSSLGLEEKEYDPKTESELVSEAEAELLPAYTEDVNAAEEKLQKTLDTQKEKEEEARYNEALEREDLNASFLKSLEAHRDDMIFKGLTNSTVNSAGREAIEEARSYEEKLIDSEYDRQYQKIKNSIASAQLSYDNAIREYDLNYAADLQEKLVKLKEKEEKRLEEINEYNLDIREREAEYQRERQETLSALRAERQQALFAEMAREQAEEAEHGISAQKKAEYARRAEMAKSFYQNFTRSEVSSLLASAQEELISLIGIEEYFALNVWNSTR